MEDRDLIPLKEAQAILGVSHTTMARLVREGRFTIYGALGIDRANILIKLFNEKYPDVKVDFVRLTEPESTAVVRERGRQEGATRDRRKVVAAPRPHVAPACMHTHRRRGPATLRVRGSRGRVGRSRVPGPGSPHHLATRARERRRRSPGRRRTRCPRARPRTRRSWRPVPHPDRSRSWFSAGHRHGL